MASNQSSQNQSLDTTTTRDSPALPKWNGHARFYCQRYIWPELDALVDAKKDKDYIFSRIDPKFDEMMATPAVANYCRSYAFDRDQWYQVSKYFYHSFCLLTSTV